MPSNVAQLVLQTQPITYTLTDKFLKIVELGGTIALHGQTEDAQPGIDLVKLIPELVGYEQDIAALFEGELTKFELPLVNRELESGKVLYTSLVNLPYSNPSGEITGLLTILSDVSASATIEQNLQQQQNELALVRHELLKQNQKLQSAIAELQRLDEVKSHFISIAAHELRNPIATVLLYARMLLHEQSPSLASKHAHHVEIIHRNAERLIHITNNLLDQVRLDAGQLELMIESTDLLEIVRNVEADMQPILLQQAQSLNIHCAANLPKMLCDRGRLLQILSNLLDNASKYSPYGSQITLSATLADDPNSLHITVTDQGIGIPESEQPKLFQRFFRASNANNSTIKGSGLGLSIVHSLVELHSGRIWLESTVGRGTTVHVLFQADVG